MQSSSDSFMRHGVSPVSTILVGLLDGIIESLTGIISSIFGLIESFFKLLYRLGISIRNIVSDVGDLGNSLLLGGSGEHTREIIPSGEFRVDVGEAKDVHNSCKEPGDHHHDELHNCVQVPSLINTGKGSDLNEGEQHGEEVEDP